MPQVVEAEGYRVMVYTRDEHPPAHVHVAKSASTIRALLHADGVEYDSYVVQCRSRKNASAPLKSWPKTSKPVGTVE